MNGAGAQFFSKDLVFEPQYMSHNICKMLDLTNRVFREHTK